MSFWSRITYAFRGDRLNHEIDEEFAAHIEEAIAAGNDPTEVRRTFGSQLRLREQSRDARIIPWLDCLRADLVFGWRQLLKRKITTSAAVLSLALAIGACTSAFRLIDALFLRPLPVAHAGSLYALARQGPDDMGVLRTFDDFAYPNFIRMRDAAKGQAELIATSFTYRTDLTYATDNEMEKGYVQYVSGTMFPIFGLQPTLGRLFTADDDITRGAYPYAVISYNYRSRRFANDPHVLGRTVRIGSKIFQIIGVGPRSFSKRERGAMNLHRFYAVNQIEYCRNFIFKRHFPIHRIFERSCEMGLWRLTAHKISEIFGVRVTKKLKGKLNTTLEQIEHGHHIFRAYFKHAFVKQYEKFSIFLRNEICSNNLCDFRLKKGLDHLAAAREKFLAITDRFATFQAQCLNVHVEFPLLQRLALPIAVGTAKFPGIKIHDTRMIRLMEVLLHGGTTAGGWTAKQIHDALLTAFHLSAERYGLNQLRYDLRKMKAHGLIERDGKRYAYRLTGKGTKVALTFVLFHQRLCGPLANSLFHHQPNNDARPNSKLEAAFHKADESIRNVIQLLEAA